MLSALVVSCTSDESTGLVDAGDPSDVQETDIGAPDVADADSQDSDDAAHDVDSGSDVNDEDPYPPGCDPDRVFEKPEVSESPEYEFVAHFAPEDEDSFKVTNRGPTTRDHMMATRAALESWLYPGEYFVLDRSTIMRNRWWLPSDYRLVAIMDGEAIPSRVETVEHQYPSIEEIESWDESLYDKHHTIHVPNFDPVHFTFVIPPWVFPEEGAYNVQVFFFPKWEPAPEARYLSTSHGVGAGTLGWGFTTTHTIYYGDTCLTFDGEGIPSRQDEAKKWESTDPGSFAGRLNFMFLAPDLDICDWIALDGSDHETCLSDVIAFDEPTATLNFYVAGNDRDLWLSDTTDTNLYYVMRDGDVIDEFLLTPDAYSLEEILFEEEKGLVLPIEVELTEDVGAYRIVAIPEPFDIQQPDEDRDLFMGNRPVESNTLLLQYDPE